MLELYHSVASPCAQKVRWVLHEKSLDYTSHILNIVQKENLAPEYLKLNPRGVVPTLLHDGIPIVESSLICKYLEEVFPQPPLLHGDIHARIKAQWWMKTVDELVHPALGALAWSITMRRQFLEQGEEEALKKIHQVPDVVRRSRQLRILKYGLHAPDVGDAIAVYSDFCHQLERALDGQAWLGGDKPGLADGSAMPYIHALYQYQILDLFVEQQSPIADWFGRLAQRPSYRAGVVDYMPEARRELMAQHGRDARRELATIVCAGAA